MRQRETHSTLGDQSFPLSRKIIFSTVYPILSSNTIPLIFTYSMLPRCLLILTMQISTDHHIVSAPARLSWPHYDHCTFSTLSHSRLYAHLSRAGYTLRLVVVLPGSITL